MYQLTMSATDKTTQERAPLLLVFGPLADRVAGILRARPSLTSKLVFAPPRAIHAIGAFLFLGPEVAQTDADIAEIIDQIDPRELLMMAFPGCPTRLYCALDTAGNSVRDRSFYARLDEVCRGPFASALLGGNLNDMRLDFYE
jgi:hypothetical protein